MSKKLTQAEFLAKAVAVHGDRYDYSQANYIGSRTKVIIGCPIHGLFKQTPASHLEGGGCLTCAWAKPRRKPKSRMPSSLATAFLAAAKLKHGNRYDYSLIDYKTQRSHIIIKCPIHGLFKQQAGSHLRSTGCPACAHAAKKGRIAVKPSTLFIARAAATHGDYYDYSQAVYKSTRDKVTIVCPKHGAFEQLPSNHINGSGCPQCGKGRQGATRQEKWLERAQGKVCTLYFLKVHSENETFYKVGITHNSLAKRFRATGIDMVGYGYELLAKHSSVDARSIIDWEASIIESFRHLRYKPKGNFHGHTECFSSCEEILAIFPIAG
jgi:cytochrome c2